MKDLNIADLQGELTRLVEGLIRLKATLQQLVPTDDCTGARARQATGDLVTMHGRLGNLLHQLGAIESHGAGAPAATGEQGPAVDEDRLLIVTCRNAVMDALASFETFQAGLASTGGPLQAEHFKELDPSIPDRALEGIGRKIEKVLADLERRAGGKNTIVLVTERGNKVDALLAVSAPLIEKRLGVATRIVEIDGVSTITERDFRILLARVLDG